MGNTLKVGDILISDVYDEEYLVLEVQNYDGYFYYRILHISGDLDGLRGWVSELYPATKIGNILDKELQDGGNNDGKL